MIGNAPIQGTTSDYFNILADLLISAKPLETIPNTVEFIRTLTGKYAPITWFFLNNGKDINLQVYTLETRAFTAHCMAGYYAWLSTCKTTEEAAQLFVTTSESNALPFKSAKIECPVDVYVYNESNELVASVIDEKIVENELAVYVEDGAKTIDLPCDQEYPDSCNLNAAEGIFGAALPSCIAGYIYAIFVETAATGIIQLVAVPAVLNYRIK